MGRTLTNVRESVKNVILKKKRKPSSQEAWGEGSESTANDSQK